MRTRAKSQAGATEMAVMVAFGILATLSALYIQHASMKGMKAAALTANQLEGFFTSEIAACQSYFVGKAGGYRQEEGKPPVTEVSTGLENDYTKKACTNKDCEFGSSPPSVTLLPDGYPLSLQDMFQKKLFSDKGKTLIRRGLAGSLKYTVPSEETGLGNHCGLASYTNTKTLAKTCLSGGASRVSTNTVGVVFEDAVVNNLDGEWRNWDYRDIRACVTGNFEVDPVLHKIYSTAATPQTLSIVSEMRPDIGCRHRFFVEVYDSTGVKKNESIGYDARAGNFLDTTNITVSQGDEVVLSWELVSGDECRFKGRDRSTRMSEIRPQTGGLPNQTVPPPSFFYSWCGDFGPGKKPYGCQGNHSFSNRTDIRSHIDYEPDLPPLSTSGIIDWIGADLVTREKVCELTGHPVVLSFTTTSNANTTNRRTVTYNEITHTWEKIAAATNNTLLSSINCGCP